ncbi:MAG: FHA domain-containing protein [Byssovorax sp.]
MSGDDDHPPSTKAPNSLVIPREARRGAEEVPLAAQPISLEAAYAQACQSMAGVRPTGPGYRLFWAGPRSVEWMDLPDGGAYAIVGHHENCDARLREGPGVALRHLLCSTVRLADGLALRVLDLQTGVPFHLGDGVPRRSLVASGPMAFRVGEYVLGGVPVEESGVVPGELKVIPRPLARPIVSESRTLPPSIRPPQRARAGDGLWSLDDSPITSVTVLPASRSLAEVTGGGARPIGSLEAAALDELGDEGPPCAALTLSREGRSATVEITEAELDRGVIVGRVNACHDVLKPLIDSNVSRGHLLLLHHHGCFEAFDLCSTQGTYADGKSVRRVVLADEGTSLQIASKGPVTLTWKRLTAPPRAN